MTGERQPTAEQVAHELVALARRLRNGAREIYAEAGLTFVEYSLLSIVADNPGINASALALAAHIDKSTASRQLGELRRRGLLRRQPDGSSSRVQPIEITDAAHGVLDEIRQRSGTEIADRLQTWSIADMEAFVGLLRRYNTTDPFEHSPTAESPDRTIE